jgi:hypothetical protein
MKPIANLILEFKTDNKDHEIIEVELDQEQQTELLRNLNSNLYPSIYNNSFSNLPPLKPLPLTDLSKLSFQKKIEK